MTRFVAHVDDLGVEGLVLVAGHRGDDGLDGNERVAQIELGQVQRRLAALYLRDVEHVVDQIEQMATRGHDLARAVAHLRGIVGLLGDNGGEAEHGVHGRADVVAHVGEEGRLRLVGRLGRLQGARQLLVVQGALGGAGALGLELAPVVVGVDGQAEHEGRGGDGDDEPQGHVDRLRLPLDGRGGRVAHRVRGPVVDRPQVAQRVAPLHLVREHDRRLLGDAALHQLQRLSVHHVVGPVEVLQVQVPRVTLAHALGLQHEALRGRVHEVEHGLLVVEAHRQRPVDGLVGVLGVQRADILALARYGTGDGVGPRARIVDVGLRHGQARDRAAGGEVELLGEKGLAVVRGAGLLAREHDGQLRGGIVVPEVQDVGRGVGRRGDLLGDELLELGLAAHDGLDGVPHEVEVLVEILDGRVRHVVIGLFRHSVDRGPHEREDENNRDDQRMYVFFSPLPSTITSVRDVLLTLRY